MKSVAEWTEEDILNLPAGEHDWFEIKGRKAIDLSLDGVNEAKIALSLSQEVSAFANSGGGQIIFGISDQRILSTPRSVDDGGVSLTFKRPNTKEWLESWVATLVEPRLRNFNIYVVTKNGESSQIEVGRGLFILDIASSSDAPHQARDNRYYVRAASHSRPANHQMVVDIFNRRQHPQFEVELYHRPARLPHMKKPHLALGGKFTNTGRVMAHYVNLLLYIPSVLLNFSHPEYEWLESELVEFEDIPHYVYEHINTNGGLVNMKFEQSTLYEPILPGRHRKFLVDVPLATDYDLYVQRSKLRIGYEVYADNARTQSGYISLQDIPG